MPSFTLIAEKRSITYPLIGGIWFLVTLYAIAHDQYIVRPALQQGETRGLLVDTDLTKIPGT
jgi:hypothetical protein